MVELVASFALPIYGRVVRIETEINDAHHGGDNPGCSCAGVRSCRADATDADCLVPGVEGGSAERYISLTIPWVELLATCSGRAYMTILRLVRWRTDNKETS